MGCLVVGLLVGGRCFGIWDGIDVRYRSNGCILGEAGQLIGLWNLVFRNVRVQLFFESSNVIFQSFVDIFNV